jgi:hypothetical protein
MGPVTEAAVRSFGFETRLYDIRNSEGIDLAFEEMRKWRARAMCRRSTRFFEERSPY